MTAPVYLDFVADPRVQHIFKTWPAAFACAMRKSALTGLRQGVYRDQWLWWNVKSLRGFDALAGA